MLLQHNKRQKNIILKGKKQWNFIKAEYIMMIASLFWTLRRLSVETCLSGLSLHDGIARTFRLSVSMSLAPKMKR